MNLDGLMAMTGILGLVVMLLVLARLSKRLGEVVKYPPLYRLFYLAMGLIVPGLSGMFFAESRTILYLIPVALGLVLGAGITWYYWGWLIYSQDGQIPARRPQELK